MKKSILLFAAMAFAAAGQLSAQMRDYSSGDLPRDKKWWIDLQVAEHIGLNSWSSVGYVNDGLPAASITEIRGVFNLGLFRSGPNFFIDMGVGIMPASPMKSLDMSRMPMPANGTQYYLRETVSESGGYRANAHFMMTAGLSYDFQATDRLTVSPHFGVGLTTMSRRSYEVVLKEQGSNMQYNTTYVWGGENDDYHYTSGGDVALGRLNGRINFRYRLRPQTCLLVGLEYTHYFDTMDFYGHYSNTFNSNVQRSFMVAGNYMNMLGLSVGLSFK